jgi:adenylate cyclase
MKDATRLSQLVLSIDENDPETLASVGWGKAYISGESDAAAEMVDRAVALNPNSSFAWNYRGMTYVYAGQAEEALRSFENGMRLSPLDPMLFGIFAMTGFALIGLGRFDEAVAAAKKALHKHQTFIPAHSCLAAALAHLGRDAEAKKAAARLLELRPRFRISNSTHWPRLYIEGLRKAGLPE